MNQRKFNKRLAIFIALSFTAVSLIMASWFRTGSIISNSEEALSIYSPKKSAESNATVWYPIGIGAFSPFGFNRAYVFTLLAQLSSLGIPAYLNQALLIGSIMFLSLVSAYILFYHLSSGSFLISSFGSFFYLLNLYTQAQIFRRFLYPFMFALAYYPLFLFLFVRLLETKSWKYLLLLISSSVILSFSFNSPATLFPFIITSIFLVIVKIWQTRKSPRSIIIIMLLSLTTAVLWVIVNIWWLYPITRGSANYVSTLPERLISGNINFESLQAVSKSFPVSEIMLLRQSWWYGESQHWYHYYKSPFIYLLSITIFLVAIFGLIKSKKSPYWTLLAGLLIIGLFISKGTNPPLGNKFFEILFNNILYSAALRNPYEKFGLVFLLPFAFYFAYGLTYLLDRIKGNLRGNIIALSSFLFLIVLVWPMWSGGVFTKSELVKVPTYYSKANDFINQGPRDLRLFHIPITEYYGEKYDWGYYGQDPSENLFDHSSLSNTLTLNLNEMLYKRLPELSKDKNFPKLLGFLGTGYIIVHNEAINNPNDNLIENKVVDNWQLITKKTEIGKLTIYQLDPEIIRPRFYTVRPNNPDLKNYEERIFPASAVLEDNFLSINYDEISPTHFNVNIKNEKRPYILIMNDTFDKSWIASINNQVISHFKAYGLLNGWLIEGDGDTIVNIKFKVWPWD